MNHENDDDRFPYLGVSTFYNCKHTTELIDVDIAMVGVPFDHGTTNRPGTRFGPRAICTASQNYGIYLDNKGAFDTELKKFIMGGINVVDYGDVPILPIHTKTNMEMVHKTFKKILDEDVFPVGFGGDHTITFPIIKHLKPPLM